MGSLRIALGALVAGALIVLALLVQHMHKPQTGSSQQPSQPTPLVDQASLRALSHKSASSADTSHLRVGLLPPTNMWLSGLALQKIPQAVYPMPASFLAKEDGFELGLPTVTSTATEITGEHTPGITVKLDATTFQLTRYDKLSADLSYQRDRRTIGTLTVTEGSPFMFYTSASAQTMTIENINPSDVLEHTEHYIRYTRAGHTYAIATTQGTISLTANTLSLQLQTKNLVSLYALSDNTDTLRAYAGNAIMSVDVSHAQQGNNETTTFKYKTSNGKATVFVTLPYQPVAGANIGTYESIWGPMKSVAGTSFTMQANDMKSANELQLSTLTPEQKTTLTSSLQKDIIDTHIDKQDSYYAGKQLARAANLLSIAEQLHQTNSANQLKAILNKAFAERLGDQYFYYDTTLKGVAASHAAFGSEDFNDHHFHYGYWLYAGSIMAKYDSAFVDRYQKPLDLLAADIASYQAGNDFPMYRAFDPYAGHSWAAGLAPFADGNNQESSSEALHAWNSVSLWGAATHNSNLQATGNWMLAFETNTAQKAWRSVDVSDKSVASYTSPVASLNFGGKRTYATFFSAEPAAKLGIQLIPMDPSMTSFAADKTSITKAIEATLQNDNYNVPLGDYILMYLALANPSKALDLVSKQAAIDDGNSQTYLQAFVFSQQP